MFLLIRTADYGGIMDLVFTFHNVSINTIIFHLLSIPHSSLHSTMFLLIQLDKEKDNKNISSLHSTMFLLIQNITSRKERTKTTLHSTMFLLIRFSALHLPELQETLHSTMFLLIRLKSNSSAIVLICFTFHNVSINT